MRSRDICFVRVSIMAQGGDSNKRWTFKWTRLLCRSLSASLNLRSGFLQIGLLLKRLLWYYFLAQNCLWMQEWPECDSWIYVFKFRHFVRHDYPYFYDKFDDLSFAFLVLIGVIWLFMCACRLEIWHLSQ